MAKSVRI